MTKHAVCGLYIDLDSGSIEYINIRYSSASFSYRVIELRRRDMREGLLGRVYGGGVMRGLCGVHIPIGKLYLIRMPIFVHIARISDSRGHLPRYDLVVSPLKKH